MDKNKTDYLIANIEEGIICMYGRIL